MDAKKTTESKGLTEQCKQTPSVQSLDARIPALGESSKDGEYEDKKPLESKEPNVESAVELHNPDVVEPDNDPPQKMGDASGAQLSKDKAMEAIDDHHKEKELRKNELERKRSRNAEAASVLKDGEMIIIHSCSELKEKLTAASETSRLSILYFTASWCGPCFYISPVVTRLAAKHLKSVFLKVDIDVAKDVGAEWQPSCIPCFCFVKNGVQVDQYIGVDTRVLEQKIVQYAGSS